MTGDTWKATVAEIADSETPPAAHTRMLILALVASNWVILNTLLLHQTDLMESAIAVQFAVFLELLIVLAYFILSRIPAIARQIQRIVGVNK
jgi:hypothetical protein